MNAICILNAANNILNRSFKEGIGITNFKLNYLLYLLFSEYYYNTKKKVFQSNFVKTKYGPIDESVYCIFASYKDNVIKNYACDSQGIAKGIKDYEFNECLSIIWNRYKWYDEEEILSIIKEGIEYKKCNEYEIIPEVKILIDEISRKEKALENAKKYVKKLYRGE